MSIQTQTLLDNFVLMLVHLCWVGGWSISGTVCLVFIYSFYVPLRFGSGANVGGQSIYNEDIDPWLRHGIDTVENVNGKAEEHLADVFREPGTPSSETYSVEDEHLSQLHHTHAPAGPWEDSWRFNYHGSRAPSVSSSSLSSDDSPRLRSASSTGSDASQGLQPIMEERSFSEDLLCLRDGFVATSTRVLQRSKSELPSSSGKEKPRPLPSPFDSPLARKLQQERDELGYPTSCNLAALLRGARSPDLRTMSCPGSLVCTPRANVSDDPWR